MYKKIMFVCFFVHLLNAIDLKQAQNDVAAFFGASAAKDPGLVLQYRADIVQASCNQELANIASELAQLNKTLEKTWYKSLYSLCCDTTQKVYTAARESQYVQKFLASRPLQITAGVTALILYSNIRLYRLSAAYYHETNEKKKEELKNTYQSYARKILALVAREKAITIPLRDATVGFLGNWAIAQKFFGCITDWISVRSLFYIDDSLLVSDHIA